jgi:hypothetical protein
VVEGNIPVDHALSEKQMEFLEDSISECFPTCSLKQTPHHLAFSIDDSESAQNLASNLKKLLFISRGLDQKESIFSQINDYDFSKDPMDLLVANEQVVPFGEGLFVFQGEFLRVFKSLNSHFLNLAITEFDAIEQENPSVWPIDLFNKVNYFKEFPQHASLIAGIRKDHKELSSFSSLSEEYKKQNFVKLNDSFDNCKYGLQPAVCDTCYYILKNKQDVQNSIYTTYNKVFRNEFSQNNSLDRLPVFSVRDIMFVGDKQFVLHQRQLLIEKLTQFLKKTGLNCSIEAADDPFFSTSLEKKLFQFQFESKYEILASIPYLNKRIAIGSINLHLDSFSSAFNFTREGSEIYSGCIGIGFERLLLAFYSQFGNEVSKWPPSLKNLLDLET